MKKAGSTNRPDLPYIGPPDARVALLRCPVLPAAAVVVAAKTHGVQRRAIRGADPPDTSICAGRRTVLFALDRKISPLQPVIQPPVDDVPLLPRRREIVAEG